MLFPDRTLTKVVPMLTIAPGYLGRPHAGSNIRYYSGGRKDDPIKYPTEIDAIVCFFRVSDAVAGYYLTIVRYESGTSEYFGRYSGSDIHIARSTSSQSPRDLMARSWVWGATRPATKGVVRLCGWLQKAALETMKLTRKVNVTHWCFKYH